ncbi:39111_t:CDS:2, partial [Gigaspora margarita]
VGFDNIDAIFDRTSVEVVIEVVDSSGSDRFFGCFGKSKSSSVVIGFGVFVVK